LLTIIHGNTAMMLEPDMSAAHHAEALDEIVKATDRASSLTRQMLTLSRRSVAQTRQVDLNDVVSGLGKMLQILIGENVGLHLKLHAGPLMAKADAGMLDQVLMNLVVNARDAMPDGGGIVIETTELQIAHDDIHQFHDAAPGAYVCLRVSDSGCGIDSEALSHIFEPFFTTKEPGKGTGLGLSTVFGIVKQHGGAVRVDSRVGSGTTFTILLPATTTTGSAVGQSLRETSSVAVRGGSESILVVEDEDQVRLLVQRLLEVQGYRVQVVSNGAEALALVNGERCPFDLVITDMIMPGGVSGRELAARMLGPRPDLKVIYMSGYTGDLVGPGVELREGFNFLQKPFGRASFLECVRSSLDGAPGVGQTITAALTSG